MKKRLYGKREKLIGWAAIVIFVVFTAAVCWFVGRPMGKFVSEPEKFRLWWRATACGAKPPMWAWYFCRCWWPSSPASRWRSAGGYAFGAVQGTVLCMLGAFLGSVVVFAFVRRFGRELVEVFFPKEKIESLRFLQSSPKRDLLFWIVFVVPGTPKDLLCYFAGLTDLSWGKWLLICSAGRLPSIITSTVGGSAVGGRQYLFAILVFAGTMALSAVGLLIYRGLCRRHEKKQGGET